MIAQSTAPRTLTIAGHTHPVTVWARAIARARAEHTRVYCLAGEWYATSTSRPGEIYHVNGHCTCQAASRGLACKHLASVLSARLGQGELAQCATCGRIAARSEMYCQWMHVGGQDDRLQHYCAGEHVAH